MKGKKERCVSERVGGVKKLKSPLRQKWRERTLGTGPSGAGHRETAWGYW